MPDAGVTPVRETNPVAEAVKQQNEQAIEAMKAGAPISPVETPPSVAPGGPVIPGVTFQNVQTVPGNPLEVASQANPQVGDMVTTSTGQVQKNVIIPKAQQQPTGKPPAGTAQVAPVQPPKPEVTPIPLTPPQTPSAPVVAGQPKVDPIKEEAKKPDFWQNLLAVASSTGKTILELLGDFAAGYAGRSTPTEQRLQREQQLRLQGNEIQAQKDLAAANQGFNEQQQKLQIAHDTAMQQAKNDIEKQQIESNFQLRKIEIENQRQMFQLNYRWNMLSAQGNTGGASNFYKFGEQ